MLVPIRLGTTVNYFPLHNLYAEAHKLMLGFFLAIGNRPVSVTSDSVTLCLVLKSEHYRRSSELALVFKAQFIFRTF